MSGVAGRVDPKPDLRRETGLNVDGGFIDLKYEHRSKEHFN